MKFKLIYLMALGEGGEPVLLRALSGLRKQPIAARLAYDIVRLHRELLAAWQDVAEARNAEIKRLGVPDVGSNYSIVPNSPEHAAFVKSMSDLGDQEISLSIENPIVLPETITLSAEDMEILSVLFTV